MNGVILPDNKHKLIPLGPESWMLTEDDGPVFGGWHTFKACSLDAASHWAVTWLKMGELYKTTKAVIPLLNLELTAVKFQHLAHKHVFLVLAGTGQRYWYMIGGDLVPCILGQDLRADDSLADDKALREANTVLEQLLGSLQPKQD